MSWEIGFIKQRQGRKGRKSTICNAHCTSATINTLFNKPEWGIRPVRMVVFKSFTSLRDWPKAQCGLKLCVQLVIWQHDYNCSLYYSLRYVKVSDWHFAKCSHRWFIYYATTFIYYACLTFGLFWYWIKKMFYRFNVWESYAFLSSHINKIPVHLSIQDSVPLFPFWYYVLILSVIQ